MMKVLTVVGARPQFIKASVVSPRLRHGADEVLVHTGQHYDVSMSDVFFSELGMPQPDYHLNVGSASHGEQTARMLSGLEPIFMREAPDVVLLYGDTNSTLAGALVAAKLTIPVAHVEAGLRSFNRAMPEETNRIVTDHVASRLYCPTPGAIRQLEREGIPGALLTGDVMDELVLNTPWRRDLLSSLQLEPRQYYLVTIHRQENTDDPGRLKNLVEGLSALPGHIVWPIHPRTAKRLEEDHLLGHLGSSVRLLDPVGYQDMITLEAHAQGVLTDSGGVQREAAALGVPVFVLRNETEWTDLVDSGRAVLVGTDPGQILDAVRMAPMTPYTLHLDRRPSEIIVEDLHQHYE